MKSVLILAVLAFAFALLALVVRQMATEIHKGVAAGHYVRRGGKILRRDRNPIAFWFQFALLCGVGGAAAALAAATLWAILRDVGLLA